MIIRAVYLSEKHIETEARGYIGTDTFRCKLTTTPTYLLPTTNYYYTTAPSSASSSSPSQTQTEMFLTLIYVYTRAKNLHEILVYIHIHTLKYLTLL